MRRFVLGQVVATLAVLVSVLGSFAIFDVWQKSLEARVAAMAIALFFVVYPAIILFRLLMKRRLWDSPTDVAFMAAACVTIMLMGPWGAVLMILAVSVGSLVVAARSLKSLPPKDMRWSWQHPDTLLWVQFMTTFTFLLWMVMGFPV